MRETVGETERRRHDERSRAGSGDRPLAPVLLYDGVCGFCNRTVMFLLERDPGGLLRFAPLQGATARAIMTRHPDLHGVDSLVLVRPHPDGETVVVRSDAVLALAGYLGGPWRAAAVFRIIPRRVRDWAYSGFARVRYRVFGRHATCPVPDDQVRGRFLP